MVLGQLRDALSRKGKGWSKVMRGKMEEWCQAANSSALKAQRGACFSPVFLSATEFVVRPFLPDRQPYLNLQYGGSMAKTLRAGGRCVKFRMT
jgi:hypothetical protein